MDKNYEAIAEALLFASGDIVSLNDISRILCIDKDTTEETMVRLTQIYENSNGGILIRKIGEGYQMCSKPEYHEDIREYFENSQKQGLSRAAMETLSIVAYNQPITRAGIEYIRGVNSDSSVLKLVERGLIKECGRSDNPGRPMLYATTDHFLRSVGISSISELPPLEDIKKNDVTENDVSD